MIFVLKIISKYYLRYFELRGVTSSFAQLGLGNNRVVWGIFLGNVVVVLGTPM